MTAAESSKELTSLLKSLRADYASVLAAGAGGNASAVGVCPTAIGGLSAWPCPLDPDEPILGCFVKSFLLWESTTPKAAQALKRIEGALVDFNELRACMPDEIVRVIGERYPRSAERALRLRTALNILFSREHRVTLQPLMSMEPVRARQTLDQLEGVPPFVAARVCLLALGHHAAPVDSRILRRLLEAKVVPPDSTLEHAAAFLERKTRPGELPETYTLLQAWADDASYPPAETHLTDLRPRHKPVAEHVRREQEAARKAARRAKAAAKRRPGKSRRSTKRRPGR